jgi:hypothetical protein
MELTKREAEVALHEAQEKLFRSLKEYIHKVEGSLQRIHFYKDLIIKIRNTLEYF